MDIRDPLVATPESGTAVANLDFEEENIEGRPKAAIPQLINVLVAIPRIKILNPEMEDYGEIERIGGCSSE